MQAEGMDRLMAAAVGHILPALLLMFIVGREVTERDV